jgi:hypothetical protein
LQHPSYSAREDLELLVGWLLLIAYWLEEKQLTAFRVSGRRGGQERTKGISELANQ